jgi:hypothetical protein
MFEYVSELRGQGGHTKETAAVRFAIPITMRMLHMV